MLCERCHKNIHFLEKCNFCGRAICRDCVKASRRVEKRVRIVICKDCWSSTATRFAYKRYKPI